MFWAVGHLLYQPAKLKYITDYSSSTSVTIYTIIRYGSRLQLPTVASEENDATVRHMTICDMDTAIVETMMQFMIDTNNKQ